MQTNKIIFFTIFEIMALLLLIISTFFIWNTFGIEESSQIAYSYTNKSERLVLDINNELSPLIPMKDNEAFNDNNKISIDINNVSKINKRYNLYLMIDENSSLNTKYLKISLGEEIYYLYNLEKFNKDDKIYYFLKTGEIKSKEIVNFDLHLWLANETPNEEQGKKLGLNFKVEEM